MDQNQVEVSVGVFVTEGAAPTFFRIEKDRVPALIEKEVVNRSKRVLFIDGEPAHTGDALMTSVFDTQKVIKSLTVEKETLPFLVE